MPNFHIEIERPVEIIARLGQPELHWKKGRSAFELSTAWMHSRGIPQAVQSVLDRAPEWRAARLLDAIFERRTSLPGQGLPSQTDLLGIVALKDGNAILGVEGKVDEPFGELVGDWLAGEPKEKPDEDSTAKARRERSKKNREMRLGALCTLLEIDSRVVDKLYYQLFHRTCAAIYEAKRFGYRRATMLVHSFAELSGASAAPPCFDEFSAFSHVAGMPVQRPGSVSPPKMCGDVEVRLAWVSDLPWK